MKKLLVLLALLSAGAPGPIRAADEAAIRKDLTAVIALQGLACGEVVRFEVKGDNDYVATCKDGNRYRVFTNPQGRVVVRKV